MVLLKEGGQRRPVAVLSLLLVFGPVLLVFWFGTYRLLIQNTRGRRTADTLPRDGFHFFVLVELSALSHEGV